MNMAVLSVLLYFLFFPLFYSRTVKSCNMETFQIPSFYVLHKGGYAILRQCPPGRFFIPRLCRCVVRRLATVPWPVQTTRSLAATLRPLPTTFLPVTIEERSPATLRVSTVNPLVTNSFAVSGGGFNLQSDDLFGNDDSIAPVQRNRSRRLLQHEKETLKSSQKSSLQSSSNKKRAKSRLTSRRKRKNRKTDKTMKKNRNRDKSLALPVGQPPNINDKMLKNIPLRISEPPKTSKKLRKIPFESPDLAPCNPYFRFVFDRTHLSEDKSVPSSPSKSIRFLGVAGSTGDTSAYLDGNTSVSVWGMSHITFAPSFQFLTRFRLRGDYPYEDTFYTLIADGPCEGLPQQYSVTANPVRREIHSFIKLKNKEELDLLLPDVDMSKWVSVSLHGADGEITLFTDQAQTRGNIGVSTINSSACPMEIGRQTPLSKGFVGFIDIVQFHNCF